MSSSTSGGRRMEFTETYSYTIVAASIKNVNYGRRKDGKDKEYREIILEGNRCLDCLASLDGIFNEMSRVAIFNTIENLKISRELQLTKSFAPNPVRIALAMVHEDKKIRFLSAQDNRLSVKCDAKFMMQNPLCEHL